MLRTIAKIINKVPGRKHLAEYRFLPLLFVFGAAIEFCMINWHVGEVNFYKTFKKRKVQEIVDARILKESTASN